MWLNKMQVRCGAFLAFGGTSPETPPKMTFNYTFENEAEFFFSDMAKYHSLRICNIWLEFSWRLLFLTTLFNINRADRRFVRNAVPRMFLFITFSNFWKQSCIFFINITNDYSLNNCNLRHQFLQRLWFEKGINEHLSGRHFTYDDMNRNCAF